MIKRLWTKKIKEKLNKSPVLALLGARQIGKTTLAKIIQKEKKAIYLDLEAPGDLVKLEDAQTFLTQNSKKLIILDEIQRRPDLFNILRGIVDNNRQKGFRNEQFLLLGSASIDLLKQSSESLAGRIHYLEMSGLNILEIQSKKTQEIQKLWLRGGFPDSYLATSDNDSMEWLEMLIRTYLERDVPQLGLRIPAVRLRRLWTMACHSQGEALNFSKLGTNLELDAKTISHYLDLLVDLRLMRKLLPWYENVKKRLVKSPRFYVRDSGLLHRLLNVGTYDDLLSHPVLGKSWEGFVIENILSILPNTIESYYYRTQAGSEIDLLIKFSHKEIWAIEIKNGAIPKISKGFHQGCDDVKATYKIVIHGGLEDFPMKDGVKAMSLPSFLNHLTAKF